MKGDVLRSVREGNQAVPAICWLAAPSATGGEEDGLLLALHPPSYVVLWNMETGARVWRKSYGDTVLGFDLDPFTPGGALLRGAASFLFLHDVHPSKCPKSEGKKFYLTAGKGCSPGKEMAGGQEEQRSKRKGTRLRRMVRSMVLGGEVGGEQEHGNDCLSALYHKAVPSLVLLAYTKELLLLDTELGQTVTSSSSCCCYSCPGWVYPSGASPLLPGLPGCGLTARAPAYSS